MINYYSTHIITTSSKQVSGCFFANAGVASRDDHSLAREFFRRGADSPGQKSSYQNDQTPTEEQAQETEASYKDLSQQYCKIK